MNHTQPPPWPARILMAGGAVAAIALSGVAFGAATAWAVGSDIKDRITGHTPGRRHDRATCPACQQAGRTAGAA